MRLEPQGPQAGAEELPAALAAEARMVLTRVYCVQHGRMVFDWSELWWKCSGWAGEGCLTGMIVTAEQVARGEIPPGARIERQAA